MPTKHKRINITMTPHDMDNLEIIKTYYAMNNINNSAFIKWLFEKNAEFARMILAKDASQWTPLGTQQNL